MEKHVIVPVWFFVGLLLAAYGLLVLAGGLAAWANPGPTVLAHLRAPVWWGGVLTLTGAGYCAAFWPRRGK
jgi:hypothetical protein